MPRQSELDVQGALIYFHAYMYGPYRGRARLFRLRGLEPRMVMSEDWEVFASILLKSMGSASRAGPDLGQHEVKSAIDGNAFEYQYHRKSWEDKLAADSRAGHVFIWHRDELAHVEVWFCEGSAMNEQFDKWKAEKPYADSQQQRFRKSIGRQVGEGKRESVALHRERRGVGGLVGRDTQKGGSGQFNLSHPPQTARTPTISDGTAGKVRRTAHRPPIGCPAAPPPRPR